MKKIILVLILLSSSVAYAGDPYVKTFYKGKNWTVLEVGITGECKLCTLRSSPFYLDNGKNPKYGTTYLEISYPSNNVTFSGENIGAYFRISKQAMLQVDDGESIAINPETPMPGKSIVENMMKGMTAKITIDFGGGPLDIHTFSLLGFTKAYNMLQACAGTSSGPAAATKSLWVKIGTPADTVLELRGKGISSRQVGRDENGLLVEWEYPDVTYLMGRRVQNGIEAYRVIKITPRR